MRFLRDKKKVEIPPSLEAIVRRDAAFYLLDDTLFGNEAKSSAMKGAADGAYHFRLGPQIPWQSLHNNSAEPSQHSPSQPGFQLSVRSLLAE